MDPRNPVQYTIPQYQEAQVDAGAEPVRNGRWTSEEHALFLKGLQLYGKDWKMISNIVKSRSLVQIRTHAQKYFMKQEKSEDSGPKRRISDDMMVTPQIYNLNDLPPSDGISHLPNTPLSRGFEGRPMLHIAILEGNGAEIKNLVTTQPPSAVNEADQQGFTPIMIAVCIVDNTLSEKLCQFLISHGANLAATDNLGYTPLHWACAIGNRAIISLLIEMGAVVEAKSKNLDTPLHMAARFGRTEAVTLLLKEFKADSRVLNLHHQTPFDIAGCPVPNIMRTPSRSSTRQVITECDPFFKMLVLSHPDCADFHVPIPAFVSATLPLPTPPMPTPTPTPTPTQSPQWEDPERVESILTQLNNHFRAFEYNEMDDFPLVSDELLAAVHTPTYLNFLAELNQKMSEKGSSVPFTPKLQATFHFQSIKNDMASDTSFGKGSLMAAKRAAGSICRAVEEVVESRSRNAFCCVRPPGHHAGVEGLMRTSLSCGFCIINSVACGTLYALKTYPDIIKKVAIVDIDAHHGNGTEEIIKGLHRPDEILFTSIHLFYRDDDYEFYPGTGDKDDIDSNIFNIPLNPLFGRPQAGDRSQTRKEFRTESQTEFRTEFRTEFLYKLLPLVRAFKPDIILVSSGFGLGKADIANGRHKPQYSAGSDLSPEDFEWVGSELQSMANLCCKGRLVSILEGGYGHYFDDASQGITLTRWSLANNAIAFMRGLVGVLVTPRRSNQHQQYCLCNEDKSEFLICCGWGQQCGGWVHPSCAGLDNLSEKEALKLVDYVCPFCRAEGVSVNSLQSPEFFIDDRPDPDRDNLPSLSDLAGLAEHIAPCIDNLEVPTESLLEALANDTLPNDLIVTSDAVLPLPNIMYPSLKSSTGAHRPPVNSLKPSPPTSEPPMPPEGA